MAAEYPADLGPETIDVGRYPRTQRKAYPLFLTKCGTCHSPARAVNAPWSDGEKWRRYVEKRQAQFDRSGAQWLKPKEQDRLISFLVFDSQVRKVNGAAAFQDLQTDLKHGFALVLQKRALGAAAPPEGQP